MRRRHVPSKTHARGEEKRRKRQKGFTLIEMLAVVIILVIVAAIGFVVVNNQIEKARENTDAANIRTVADAVQRFIMENSKAPENVEKLVTEGYLAAAPQDPWGDHDNPNEYITITPQNRDVEIKSAHGKEVKLQNALPQ